ncbi:MAG: 50S ribosomal protein L9 [Chloroflexi bacterium]|nr:50S ribosomal protein L9 [Chloroflexota bacterium]|tara:strand:- start:1004 stop:1672 length:669 start_codon:yes stop_codon:yes gene_type:complete
MKVLFLESIEGSASMGEIKDVANGYARNYLFPNGFAVPATPKNLKNVEELQAKELEIQTERDNWASEIIDRVEDTIIFKVAVGQQGRLYGSVNNADIAQKLSDDLNSKIDRRMVLMSEIIRQSGVYEIGIRLSKNVVKESLVVVADEQIENIDQTIEEMINDYKSGNITENIASEIIYEDELDEISSDELSKTADSDVPDEEIAQIKEETEDAQEQITESES